MFEEFLLPQNIPTLIFIAGFFFQAALFAKEKLFSKWVPIGIVAVLIFVIVLGLFSKPSPGLFTSCMTFFFILAIFSILFLRDRVLFELTEIRLLLFALSCTVFSFVLFGLGNLLFYFFAIVLLFAVVLCLFDVRPGFKTKLFFYILFLFQWIFLFFLIWGNDFWVVFLKGFSEAGFPGYTTFFIGMSSFSFFAVLIYLWMLLPVPGEHESFASALSRAKENARAMVAKFEDVDASRRAVLGVFIIAGGLLLIVFWLNLLSVSSLAAIILVVSSNLDSAFPSKTVNV